MVSLLRPLNSFVSPLPQLTEEFVEHCAEGALSVEVYGHRSAAAQAREGAADTTWDTEQQMAKARSLADR